jgi:hypothetical protein
MAVKVKQFELRFAQLFLRALHANERNSYLILAVVAWLRSESGTNYIGNNPLNLRPGADDARYRSGVRKTLNGNGYFSVYSSLEKAAKASANRILRAGNDYRGYGLIVRAAQRKAGTSTASEQGQAIDFLTALALSKWDAGHYGTGKNVRPETYDGRKNKLIKVWAGLTGQSFTLPQDPPKPAKKKKKAIPRQPRATVHENIEYNYLKPYAAFQFYEERHRAEPTETSGDGDVADGTMDVQ